MAVSGLSHAISNLTAGDDADIGAIDAPLGFSNGSYFVDLTDNADGTYTAVATGTTQRGSRTIDLVLPWGLGQISPIAAAMGKTRRYAAYSRRTRAWSDAEDRPACVRPRRGSAARS